MKYLSDKFLSKYKKIQPPFGGNGLGEFVFLRTYSRLLSNEKRRELWWETVARTVEYNISKIGINVPHETLCEEAELLFDSVFNMRVFPSGRSLWVGGTEAAEKFPTSTFNCAGVVIDNLEAIKDAFHLLMVGAGVGYRVLPTDVSKISRFYKNITLKSSTYNPVPKAERLEFTQITQNNTGDYLITVGDSKEGWTDAMYLYLQLMQKPDTETIIFNYDSVRGKGELLKTFGGRAAGPDSIRLMVEGIHNIITTAPEIWLRPVDYMDIIDTIAYYVVVGGVRRSSTLCLFDIKDDEIRHAKDGLWVEGSPNYGKVWRGMSNNSIYFENTPTLEQLREIMESVKRSGEPGFINAAAAKKRRPDFNIVNPCAEILLNSRGTCNLCEVNVFAHIINGNLNVDKLDKSVRLATRMGLRQTNVTLDLLEWAKVQSSDRLLGVSIMGWVDTVEKLSLSPKMQDEVLSYMRNVANDEARKYAFKLRIPTPLLVTTVKPGGSIPLLPTVSSGAHKSFAPYFVRRVRINATDPLARVMQTLNYPIYPESGQGPSVAEFDKLNGLEQQAALDKANTWVIEFPVKTSAKTVAYDELAVEQLARYFTIQKNYADHNTSVTIYVGDDEWDAVTEMVYVNWDDFIGVSFLPKNTSIYPLLPFEPISYEEYLGREDEISDGNIVELLTQFEEVELSDELDASCATGICPQR